jgi:hypothetical protein
MPPVDGQIKFHIHQEERTVPSPSRTPRHSRRERGAHLGGGHGEPGVRHAERLEHPLAEHLGERRPRDPLDQDARDCGPGVVSPCLSR